MQQPRDCWRDRNTNPLVKGRYIRAGMAVSEETGMSVWQRLLLQLDTEMDELYVRNFRLAKDEQDPVFRVNYYQKFDLY